MDSTLFTTRALNSVEMKETLNIACTLSAGLNVKIIIRKGTVAQLDQFLC